MRVLIIDNYDSFTWNLVHACARVRPGLALGSSLIVARNDEIHAAGALALQPTHLIISPGPGTPSEAGCSQSIMQALAGHVPILGVCLGHQAMGVMHAMTVRTHRPIHGKTSLVHHDARGLFTGLPSPFSAMRYHSLVIDAATIPASGWTVSAWTTEPDGTRVVMGLRREWEGPLWEGVQFHPESYMTEHGERIMGNFLGKGPQPPSET